MTDNMHMVFDDRFDSYESFFDYGWVGAFLDISKRSRVDDAALVLTRDWKSAAMSARLPWLMVHFLDKFQEGFTKQHPPLGQQLLTALADDLASEGKIRKMAKQALLAKMNQHSANLLTAMQNQPAFDAAEAWREFTREKEFTMSVWSLQRMAYNAIYQAYENFVQRVIEIGRNDPTYRAKHPEVRERNFVALFGQQLADDCINHPDMDTARLVRNCLSHDGGRESDDLRAKKHGIPVVDGELQLMPEHVRGLFDLLKMRATKIVEAAAQIPAFKL